MSLGKRLAITSLLILALGTVVFSVAVARTSRDPEPVNPLAGIKLYAGDPTLRVFQQKPAAGSDEETAYRHIGEQPQGHWIAEVKGSPKAEIELLMSRAEVEGAVPVIVPYNIPNRDCGQHSAGGTSADAYRAWIRDVAAGIGPRRAIVVLEPDALAGWDCLDEGGRKERQVLMADAVDALKANAQTYVYLDAGNPTWVEPEKMAARLKPAGVDKADGFAVNVSNYYKTEDSISYGRQVGSILGGKHFIVDTSRNGRGPAGPHDWCNPPGRGLGKPPTVAPEQAFVDAYLWVKNPGDSDGDCNGGPKAGDWWAQRAVELSQLRIPY